MDFPVVSSPAITRALIKSGHVTRGMLNTHEYDADFEAQEAAEELRKTEEAPAPKKKSWLR